MTGDFWPHPSWIKCVVGDSITALLRLLTGDGGRWKLVLGVVLQYPDNYTTKLKLDFYVAGIFGLKTIDRS